MTPLVEMRHVEKLAQPRALFHDLSLTLERGRFYALVGKTGAGKSTLLRLLMRYETPDRGEITLFGAPTDDGNASPNTRIGFVSENSSYTVPLPLRDLFSKQREFYPRWDSTLFERMLGDLRLNGRSRLPELSRGQRVKLAFANALALRPTLLLLDDITPLLDIGSWNYCLRALEGFVANGGTVLMATTVASELEHYASDLLVLDEGHIKFQAAIDSLDRTFCKLRRPADLDHPIFHDERCVTLTHYRDGSSSVLVPTAALATIGRRLSGLIEHEVVKIEDLVIYVLGRESGGKEEPC